MPNTQSTKIQEISQELSRDYETIFQQAPEKRPLPLLPKPMKEEEKSKDISMEDIQPERKTLNYDQFLE